MHTQIQWRVYSSYILKWFQTGCVHQAFLIANRGDWAESHGGRIASLIVQQTMASLETVLVLVFD